MSSEKNKRNITPLGEKFDKAQLPFEPDAWVQMESLLAEENKKKTLKRLTRKKIIATLIIAFMTVLSLFFTRKKPDYIDANNYSNLENETKINHKKSNLEDSVFNTASILKQDNSKMKLLNQHHSNTLKFNYDTPQYLSIISENSRQNTSISRPIINKTQLENYANKTFNNPNILIKNSEAITDNKTEIDKQKNEDTPQYLGIKGVVKETEKSVQESQKFNYQKFDSDTLLSNQSQQFEDILTNKNTNESSENMPYKPIERLAFEALKMLPLIQIENEIKPETNFDFTQFDWAMAHVIPIVKPLWEGRKHELTFGFSNINDNNALQLRYVRRVTPLLGLGISTIITNSQNGVYRTNSSLELEGQFYLLHRKRFEMVVTLGYGFNWVKDPSPDLNKTYRGFSLGIEPRLLITHRWNLAVRFEARYIVPNVLLQLGYRF